MMEEKLKKLKDYILSNPYIICYDGELNIDKLLKIEIVSHFRTHAKPAMFVVINGCYKFDISESEFAILIEREQQAKKYFIESKIDDIIKTYNIK